MQGQVKWSRQLGKMQTRNSFGEGASPALYNDTLVVPWDHEGQSKIFALNTADGTTRWEKERDEPTTWATPLITEYQGRVQVILNGTNQVTSYDLKDGSVIWSCRGQVANPIPTPIRDGDYVLVMTGYRGFAIQSIALSSKGDVSESSAVRWTRNDAAPYVASGVLFDGLLYITKSREAILSILSADTGKVLVDQERMPQLDGLYASLIAANGHIFAVGRNGTTLVLKHGPEMSIVATNKLDEGIDASPVAVGKQLFLRGATHLYCVEGP
jgi:outer membrane protein assembly factor BamB